MAITTLRSFVTDDIAYLDGLVGDFRRTNDIPGIVIVIVIGIVDREHAIIRTSAWHRPRRRSPTDRQRNTSVRRAFAFAD
jgi:hypothetical protein